MSALAAPPVARLRRLADVRFADAPVVGSKAASLGELIAAGVRVPEGVVLEARASELEAAERAGLVRDAVAQLGDGPFAVRSSGVAEDGEERSFAGMFETRLGVSADDVPSAIEAILASATNERAAGYRAGDAPDRMAVIVQRMVQPVAAGVALTADPVTGDRAASVVTAVKGTGERLVSGEAFGDEWLSRGGKATQRRRLEGAIDGRQAREVALEAGRIAAVRGAPQDVEWAIDRDGLLWIVQARPMTALPPDVSWDAPAKGAFTRTLRFGEWISEPVTPLFETWLLPAMEERFHGDLLRLIGQKAPPPYHVVVNGWYFYSLNWMLPGPMLGNLPRMLGRGIREPRLLAGVLPPTVRHSIPLLEREWREDVLPRHRAAVELAEERVQRLSVGELPALVDELADLAGAYFTSIAAFAGSAYKMEINLARFYRRHIGTQLGGSHLPLLTGFDHPVDPGRHAVVSLDWWRAPGPRADGHDMAAPDRTRLIAERTAAEAAAFEALAASPKKLAAFRSLLAETQRLVPIREEHVREFTLPWPAMRRAVLRLGEALVERGVIREPEDVFFLTRDEALGALGRETNGEAIDVAIDVASRRHAHVQQSRLVAPLFVGNRAGIVGRVAGMFAAMVGGRRSDRAIVSGSPASPGRATGKVRVVRSPEEFGALQPGEILVAPVTAPAWTPLFARAAAVVTDVGSAAAHASIIAREYGIPAVVGCGDATARLRDGMMVTVDGTTGNVEPG